MSGVEGESVSTRDALAPDLGVMLLLREMVRSSSFRSGDRVCCRRLREATAAGEVGPLPARRGAKDGFARRLELKAGVRGLLTALRVLFSVGMVKLLFEVGQVNQVSSHVLL